MTTETLTLTQARDRAIETLQDAVEKDLIELDDFEAKMDAVMQAPNHHAIAEVVEGLPSSQGAIGEVRSSFDPAPMPIALSAVFGGASRKPVGVLPREMKARAVFGGVDLDLREARFQPGITLIRCTAVFGGVDIQVPPDVRLEVLGSGIFGGFDESGSERGRAESSGDVIVRVVGKAVFGGVSAKKKKADRG